MQSKTQSAPYFPKRAVITAGMPYGDKLLHFGHVYGCHLHADIYTRFLQDRIGRENVIFVSGTDCYGAGIEVKHKQAQAEGFGGTIADFVQQHHDGQIAQFVACGVEHSLYGASGLGLGGDLQADVSRKIFDMLRENKMLRAIEALQFVEAECGTILNGRQVEGRCPIQGCKSEKAYADECSLGHQFAPEELIAPISVVSGKKPGLRGVKNWYFDLEAFGPALAQHQETLRGEGISRKFLLSYVDDFLKKPQIYIKIDDPAAIASVLAEIPPHTFEYNEQAKSATITFDALPDREAACAVLRRSGIRLRTGTTLVPFRLTGNVTWGITLPDTDGISEQTFWCWAESLWAHIAFTQAFLLQTTGSPDGWQDWWLNADARVYQFIGEDNAFFYAVAGIGVFMAMNQAAGKPHSHALPVVVPNRHVLYMGKKASSSSAQKPPGATDFLDFYTRDQLRMHFAHMALGTTHGSFIPKTAMKQPGFDATLAEGNILTNVFNRIVRSCFYSVQKYYDGALPRTAPGADMAADASKLISDVEWAMYRFEFARAIDLLDEFLRKVSRDWSAKTKAADAQEKSAQALGVCELRTSVLVDTFHAVRVATALLRPFAPDGTAIVAEYLATGPAIFDWRHINQPLSFFMDENHSFKFLEPRVDFFAKHPAQLGQVQ